MIEQGRWLMQTSVEAERLEFEDLYDITVPKLIEDYELERFEIDPKVKAFVFLEYDGEANKIIRLQEFDSATIYGEGCYGLPINTCGMAVLEVYSGSGFTHQWVVENSPYELTDGDSEWDEMYRSPEGVIAYEPLLNGLAPEEVMFVRQL